MDLSTIRLRLTDYLNDASTARFSTTTRDAYINIAYHEVCNADNWPFREATDTSITTVSGTQAYTMPAAVNLPLGMWVTAIFSPNKLAALTRKEREIFAVTGNAKPVYYFRFGTQFYLYPTPDQAYPIIIEYQKKIADLSLDADVPIFDADFHYLIPLRAASTLKRTNGGEDMAEADRLDKLYLEGLEQMKARLLPKDLDRRKAVVSLYEKGNYNNFLQSFY
jgi:hypothetical protein